LAETLLPLSFQTLRDRRLPVAKHSLSANLQGICEALISVSFGSEFQNAAMLRDGGAKFAYPVRSTIANEHGVARRKE
jgi:hypothetical protein